MTVVVYDGQYMAADKLLQSTVKAGMACKLLVHDGYVYGFSGYLSSISIAKQLILSGQGLADMPIGATGGAHRYAIMRVPIGESKGWDLFDDSGHPIAMEGFGVIGATEALFASAVLNDVFGYDAPTIVKAHLSQPLFEGLDVVDCRTGKFVTNLFAGDI